MEKYVDILFMFVKAFAVGGAICTVAQVVINKTKLTAGRILVRLVRAGVALGAFGLYDYIVQFAGAGATVPISGFGYLLARGGIRGAEKGLFYALTGPLAAASAGVTAAVAFSFLFALIFRPKSKKN